MSLPVEVLERRGGRTGEWCVVGRPLLRDGCTSAGPVLTDGQQDKAAGTTARPALLEQCPQWRAEVFTGVKGRGGGAVLDEME